jgi:hypothetical protein
LQPQDNLLKAAGFCCCICHGFTILHAFKIGFYLLLG